MTVLEPPRSLPIRPSVLVGFQAKPTFGGKLSQSVWYGVTPTFTVGLLFPLSTPGVNSLVEGPRMLATSGEAVIPLTSYIGPWTSQRKPKFKVKLGLMRQRSWIYAPPIRERVQVKLMKPS